MYKNSFCNTTANVCTLERKCVINKYEKSLNYTAKETCDDFCPICKNYLSVI